MPEEKEKGKEKGVETEAEEMETEEAEEMETEEAEEMETEEAEEMETEEAEEMEMEEMEEAEEMGVGMEKDRDGDMEVGKTLKETEKLADEVERDVMEE